MCPMLDGARLIITPPMGSTAVRLPIQTPPADLCPPRLPPTTYTAAIRSPPSVLSGLLYRMLVRPPLPLRQHAVRQVRAPIPSLLSHHLREADRLVAFIPFALRSNTGARRWFHKECALHRPTSATVDSTDYGRVTTSYRDGCLPRGDIASSRIAASANRSSSLEVKEGTPLFHAQTAVRRRSPSVWTGGSFQPKQQLLEGKSSLHPRTSTVPLLGIHGVNQSSPIPRNNNRQPLRLPPPKQLRTPRSPPWTAISPSCACQHLF